MKKKITLVTIGLAALLVIVCFAIMYAPWRYVSIKSTTGVSEEEFKRKMEMLDEVYETYHFSKNAEQFYSEAQARGYDEYLAPAVAALETYEIDRSIERAKNNLYSIIERPTTFPYQARGYETEEECIEDFFNILDLHYGDITIFRFAKKWTPYDQEEYAIKLYEKMHEIEDL